MHFYFFSNDDEPPILIAQIEFKDPGPASRELAVHCEQFDEGDVGPFVSEIIPSDGSRDLGTVCNTLIDRWIEVWTKVGGLRQFLPEKV